MTIKINLWVHFRIKLQGIWQKEHEAAVILGVQYMAEKIAQSGRNFKDELGGVTLTWGSEGATGECANATSGGCTSGRNRINFWSMSGDNDIYGNTISRHVYNVVHEFGHVYNNRHDSGPSLDLDNGSRTLRDQRGDFLHPNGIDNYPTNGAFYPHSTYWNLQQHPPEYDVLGWSGSETFADMFVAWTFDAWNVDHAALVSEAQRWMENWLP